MTRDELIKRLPGIKEFLCEIFDPLSEAGYAIVPVEPTEDIIQSYFEVPTKDTAEGDVIIFGDLIRAGYKAMIEAGRVK